MVNLRELACTDLKTTLEGDFSLPVFLTSPAGVKYTTAKDGSNLVGQVLYDTVDLDPATGLGITVENPIVTLNRDSLTRIPLDGEIWFVEIPSYPAIDAPKSKYMIGWDRAQKGGASTGWIKLYLQKAEQS